MIRHWINEMMNLVAGNSRYVFYVPAQQILFILAVLFMLSIPVLLYYFT